MSGIFGGGGGAFQNQLLHFRDEKASGTNGGTFSSGSWVDRTINAIKTNEINGASLVANVLTLPIGVYYAEIIAVAWRVQNHKAKLYDTTGATDLLVGTNGKTYSVDDDFGRSFVSGRFELTAESELKVQHRCSSSYSNSGFGEANSFGVVEVYLDGKIWKVG